LQKRGLNTLNPLLMATDIDIIVEREVFFWRYDKTEDVYINKWSIANNKQLGIQYRPEFNTKEEAQKWLKTFLLSRAVGG